MTPITMNLVREKIAEMIAPNSKRYRGSIITEKTIALHLDRENRITMDFPMPISVDGLVDALKTFKTRIDELLENNEKLLEELKKEQDNV